MLPARFTELCWDRNGGRTDGQPTALLGKKTTVAKATLPTETTKSIVRP